MATSKKDASEAAKLLRKATTPKKVKSVAGSDLAQAARPKKPKNGLKKAAAKKPPKKR